MKKSFVVLAICAFALFMPALALATTVGGSANAYHLECTKIGHDGAGTEAWSATAGADSLDNWTLTVAAATDFGVDETSTIVDTRNMVCPMGAGAYMGFFVERATADSIRIVPQVSPDKSSWLSLAAAAIGNASTGTVDALQGVEAATFITTPMWPYMRFIIDHYDGSAKATSISSVTVWFLRYEKDQ